jgi:hypothetical protein
MARQIEIAIIIIIILMIINIQVHGSVPGIQRVPGNRSAAVSDSLVEVGSGRKASKHVRARMVISSFPITTSRLVSSLQVIGEIG